MQTMSSEKKRALDCEVYWLPILETACITGFLLPSLEKRVILGFRFHMGVVLNVLLPSVRVWSGIRSPDRLSWGTTQIRWWHKPSLYGKWIIFTMFKNWCREFYGTWVERLPTMCGVAADPFTTTECKQASTWFPRHTDILVCSQTWWAVWIQMAVDHETVCFDVPLGKCSSKPVVPKLFRSTAPLVPYTHPQRPPTFYKKHKCAFVSTFILYLKNRLNKIMKS
jgi:hypothetical protein